MSKGKQATWWKMFSHQRAAVESVGDKAAGAGLKAAFRYFDGEDIPPGSLSPQAFTVFCVIRPYIDEARRDFEESTKNGKKGAEARWGKNNTPMVDDSPPIAPPSHTMVCLREAEAEADPLLSYDNRDCGAAASPTRPRFVPPTVEEVTAYVQERGSRVDPQAFVDFYAAKGWMVGKNKMRDWKAACRSAEGWERWDRKPAASDRDRVKTEADYGEELFFTK